MVLLPVPGWTGFCQETLDPRDEGERLWECVWRRVPLLGKVNLEMGCHGHHHRQTQHRNVATGRAGPDPGGASAPTTGGSITMP